MRIAFGGLLHETSTFAKTPTTLAHFASGFGIYRGPEILARFRGANICTGGFIDRLEQESHDMVPLLWAFAYPSGLIVADDYAALKGEFLDHLRREIASPAGVDGVLLDLHGAMVVEGIPDADGDFVAAVREVVGPDRPIVVTYDLHGNHSLPRMRSATASIGFDTYPHVDMAERGREAAELILATLSGKVVPVTAFRSIPMFWNAPCQVTGHPPMNEVIDLLHAIEQRPGILTASVSTGFPWADVPNMGSSVWVTADRDQELADRTAQELADWIWERRERWQCPPLSVAAALDKGESHGKYPIILADHADNTGGGAPGDSTEVLQTFLDRGLKDAAILYIVDPEVVELAHRAGVGAILDTEVGGKSDPIQGPPVKMRATVRALSQGDFTYDGPMYAGLTGNMGPSCWIEQNGVHVVVVTATEQPLGPAFALTLGLDCRRLKYIAVKSAVHFRASFEPFAGLILSVDARGTHTHDFRALNYQHRPRPMYPL
ncbi:MAG: M81 family metallopeptidase [Planctomycetota bacterium]|nr:M81 family metallopeptidase [Planctomycetota bacterium]